MINIGALDVSFVDKIFHLKDKQTYMVSKADLVRNVDPKVKNCNFNPSFLSVRGDDLPNQVKHS